MEEILNCIEEFPSLYGRLPSLYRRAFLRVYQGVPSQSGRVSLPVWKSSFTVQKSFPPCTGELTHSMGKFPFLYVKLPHSPGEFPFLMGYLLNSRKSLPSLLKPSGSNGKELICFLRNFKISFTSCYDPFKN